MRNRVIIPVIVLLVVPWLSSNVSAALTVTSVTLTMDRPTFYANNSVAVATADLTYTAGPAKDIGDVRFTWFRPDWSVATVYTESAKDDANASSSLTVDMTGFWYVNATYVNQTDQFDNVSFEVVSDVDVVVVSEISLGLNAPYFGVQEVVTATSVLTFVGNTSLFAVVSFTWVDSSSIAFRSVDVLPNSTGVAMDTWLADRTGAFYVYANYTGDAPVSGMVSSEVFPMRVKTWHNYSVVVDETWDAAGEPYGVCGNITISAGATLTIEAGVTVRFCEDKRMTVDGTLIADGSLGSPVNFTAYSFFPSKGYWDGIRVNSSSGNTSTIIHSSVSFASTGLLVRSASPRIERTTFRNMSIAAIQFENSTASAEFSLFENVGKGVSASSSNITLRFNTFSNVTIGLALINSFSTLHGDAIYNSTSFGIHAFNSTLTGSQINISLSSGSGLRLQSGSQAQVGSSVIEDSWFGVDAVSSGFEVNESVLRLNDNAVRANDAQGEVTNSSILDSTDFDFRLEGGSTVVALNSSFNESRIQVQPASRLIVKQFLHVHVAREDTGSPIGNAFVEVLDGGLVVFSGRTPSGGRIRWIPVTDRSFEGTNVASKHTITVRISKSGYEIADAERNVDMSISRLEVFLGTEIIQDVWGQVSDPFFLLLLLIAISVLVAAFIIARRRMGREDEEEMEPAKKVRRPEDYSLKKGASYLVSGEKPDFAFGVFSKALAGGASGLCITRAFPDEVSKQHELGSTPIIWLSRDTKRTSINPTNLGAIILEVQRFMEDAGEGETVVMLDGLEYLIVQNDFSKVVKFVQNLKDTISLSGSKLLIPFNLAALEESRQALLLRDLELME